MIDIPMGLGERRTDETFTMRFLLRFFVTIKLNYRNETTSTMISTNSLQSFICVHEHEHEHEHGPSPSSQAWIQPSAS